MYNPYSLEGKTILITGASSGIGRVTSIECSKMGAKIVLTGRNQERLEETLSMLEGGGHQFVVCDLNDDDMLDNLVSKLPEIQGLVNNAGITKIMPLAFTNSDTLKEVLNVNTVAPISLLQKILKKKKMKKGGSVVFTSSMAGLGVCAVGTSLYTASKGAISAFIRSAALELAAKKIRVNAVCPGMIMTDIISDVPISQDKLNEDLKQYPLGRYGSPEDVAFAIIYLLSDGSEWVTGDNIVIDGGLSLK